MSDQPKTVFVTKYALTGGIVEGAAQDRGSTGYAYVKLPGHAYGSTMSSKDYAPTREEAVKQAEAKRQAKIASHERSIAKLRAMTFA